ncbi:MAG: hypothetical protein GXP26_04660 [Planctomycetes bacterium]|nr:hypothetical protein [Planctomycetota bacterium]
MKFSQNALWKNSIKAALASLVLLACSPVAVAENLSGLDASTAQTYAQHLVEKMADVEGQQVKVVADPTLAQGLGADGEGVILVPAEGFKEGEENPEVHTEKGAGLALLFMSPRFNPVIEGKPIAQDKLHTISYSDGDGEEKKATCLILAIRNIAGDDWRLYAYGKDAKPLVDSKFGESFAESEGPLAIDADTTDEESSLVVTVFGKYSASFEIGQ